MSFDYDYLIVGSGFGGSVAALRIAEKGWKVAVVEQGRRIGPEDIRAGKKHLHRLMWVPRLGMRGYRDWEKRVTVFTIMQDLDNHVRFQYRRRWWRLWSRGLVTEASPGHELPSYLPVANRATREFAKVSGGTPMSTLTESIAGVSTTAHILSGCPMGSSSAESVIDVRHEVHGHPGLFVVDGASIPANIGVNPSLTITAMAERFASLQPSNHSGDI